MISLFKPIGYIAQALGIPWGAVSSSCLMKINDGWMVEKDMSKPETRELVRTSHVNACLDTWFKKAPFCAYNLTNPSSFSTASVLEMIKSILKPERDFVSWKNDADFYNTAAVALRSNCIMDSIKLQTAGITMRSVNQAIKESLGRWKREDRGAADQTNEHD